MSVQDPGRVARRRALILVLVLVVTCLSYRVLTLQGLEHTSLVFLGLPALVAILTVAGARPTSLVGTIVKVITVALCLATLLFGEAFVCILFAAPLFYLVGIVVGWAVETLIRDRGRILPSAAGLTAVMLLSLEGLSPALSLPRAETVTATRVIHASPSAIATALALQPRFDHQLPALFRLGFPAPHPMPGAGLDLGDRRVIRFSHGHHHSGSLELEVVERGAGRVRFKAQHDASYLMHWLAWQEAVVEWREVASGRTEVRWTLRYERRLDPAWYFGPLERFAVGRAAGYLIETQATPRGAGP